MDHTGKKVAILGFDVEGRASFEFFKQRGADLTIHDQNPDLQTPPGVPAVLGGGYLEGLDQYQLLVRTPGLLPYKINSSTPVTTHMNEFLKLCPAPVVGVTGSKGKGTTSTLIYEILSQISHSGLVSESYDQEIFLGGNIGTPPLEFLDQLTKNDMVVLEMSNLQLWDIEHSPEVAVLLKIAEEHLDWHRGSMEEYVNTKRQITAYQSREDGLIYFGENEYTVEIAENSPAGTKIPYFVEKSQDVILNSFQDLNSMPREETLKQDTQSRRALKVQSDKIAIWLDEEEIKLGDQTICHTSDVQLPGRHNLQNVCAAVGGVLMVLAYARLSPKQSRNQGKRLQKLFTEEIRKLVQNDSFLTAIRQTLQNFTGLPHRLQLVAELDGVKYIDDSIGTTPEAAVAAINSYPQPKIMILGGSSKGHEFRELAQAIADSEVKHVITIGTTAPEIEKALKEAGFSDKNITSFTEFNIGQLASTDLMKQVVQKAHQVAEPGDVVLLSPACASFGLFANYQDRADKFIAAVKGIKA